LDQQGNEAGNGSAEQSIEGGEPPLSTGRTGSRQSQNSGGERWKFFLRKAEVEAAEAAAAAEAAEAVEIAKKLALFEKVKAAEAAENAKVKPMGSRCSLKARIKGELAWDYGACRNEALGNKAGKIRLYGMEPVFKQMVNLMGGEVIMDNGLVAMDAVDKKAAAGKAATCMKEYNQKKRGSEIHNPNNISPAHKHTELPAFSQDEMNKFNNKRTRAGKRHRNLRYRNKTKKAHEDDSSSVSSVDSVNNLMGDFKSTFKAILSVKPTSVFDFAPPAEKIDDIAPPANTDDIAPPANNLTQKSNRQSVMTQRPGSMQGNRDSVYAKQARMQENTKIRKSVHH